jgi:serine/threonine protein kinase
MSLDMWSFACIAGEAATGTSLFQAHNNIELLLQIIKLIGTPSQQEVASMNSDFSIKEYQALPKLKPKRLKEVSCCLYRLSIPAMHYSAI